MSVQSLCLIESFLGEIDIKSLTHELESYLSKQPRVSSSTMNETVHRPMGPILSNVLSKSNQLKHQWKDDFISSRLMKMIKIMQHLILKVFIIILLSSCFIFVFHIYSFSLRHFIVSILFLFLS